MSKTKSINVLREELLAAIKVNGPIGIPHGSMKAANVKRRLGITGYHRSTVCVVLKGLVSERLIRVEPTGEFAPADHGAGSYPAEIFEYSVR